MKTTIAISIVLLIISSTSFGQFNSIDCDKNLDKMPYFVTHNVTYPSDSLQIDINILRVCGELDTIDSELLNGHMLGVTLMNLATDEKEITYRSILKSFNKFKLTSKYANFRDIIITTKILENKIVTIENWEKDKQLLAKVGMSELEIENLAGYIKAHSEKRITFKQAYAGYMASIPKTLSPEPLKFIDLGDLDNALKLGKENKKRILIYFTGRACANARKIEDYILTNEQVQNLITEHFVCFSAFVDDNTPDPNSGSTVGKKYLKLESEKFKTDYQPYFFIIDEMGNIKNKIGYTNKVEEFINFLNAGIK